MAKEKTLETAAPQEKSRAPTTSERVLLTCRARPAGATATSIARDLALPQLEVLEALADHQNRGHVRESAGVYYLTLEGQTASG